MTGNTTSGEAYPPADRLTESQVTDHEDHTDAGETPGEDNASRKDSISSGEEPSGTIDPSIADQLSGKKPEERYGDTPAISRSFLHRFRIVFIAAGLGLLILGSWLAYYFVMVHNKPPINARIETYTLDNDFSMSAQLQITRTDPQKPAACVLRAVDQRENEVGRREVYIQGDGQEKRVLSVHINTVAPGDHVLVYACTHTIPSYLTHEPNHEG